MKDYERCKRDNLRGEQEEGESKEFYTEGNEGREGEEDCKAVSAESMARRQSVVKGMM
jgi:hypothetical protein